MRQVVWEVEELERHWTRKKHGHNLLRLRHILQGLFNFDLGIRVLSLKL